MEQYLNYKYWINWYPGAFSSQGLYAFLFFLLILLLATIVFSILKNRKTIYRPIFSRLKVFSFSNLIIGMFLVFFTYQLLPILSARLWDLVWVLSMLVWAGFIVRSLLKIPELRESRRKEQAYRKYIP
jgi:hypothetical protein